jgi:hypothetical protein
MPNSMWGYPIGNHPDGADPLRWARMAAELKEVQEKLIDSGRPTTTQGEPRVFHASRSRARVQSRAEPLCKVRSVYAARCRPEVGLGDEAQMGPYRRVCGGVGGHHPAYELQEVIVLDDTHPITRGVTSFAVHDEQHFTFIDEHRGARLLLKNRGSDGRESCAGWAYEHGQGRVCYLASGHVPLVNHTSMHLPADKHDAMFHPMVQKLLRNAVAWLARVEPQQGESAARL